MSVEITLQESRLEVSSPYNPDLPSLAKDLGGRWDPSDRVWYFDPRQEERVRALYIEVYGTDGSNTKEVTIQKRYEERDNSYDMAFFLAGRQIARAFSRDSGAKTCEGVTVLEGGFSSGGSRKNPTITVQTNTLIEIWDVPEAMAKKAMAEDNSITIVK